MIEEDIKVEKLVNGGQGLGTLSDGKKIFIWNALPGEVVRARIIKKRKDYLEAIAEQILKKSKNRVDPKESNYLATSPWQILNFTAENQFKKAIIKEIFTREHVKLPKFDFKSLSKQYGYRNKMEYSFWGDDNGLHLALHYRGSQGKQIVPGSMLAMPAVDTGASSVIKELQKAKIRAGDLKTVVVRCNQDGEVVASLFVKKEEFVKLPLPNGVKALSVYYSNPKSPASIITKQLYMLGQNRLSDKLLGKRFEYNSDSFFQVNIPIFEEALKDIKQVVGDDKVIDMYGGVGSIGLSVSSDPIIIELDKETSNMAKENALKSNALVVETSAEKALDYIDQNKVLIIDPPRAGLHLSVVQKILDVGPKQVVYLSCNPVTQARDIKLLSEKYQIDFFKGYNFFPRTPHIESLAALKLI